jgi:tetratricopeptide (TPR) repeat protein
MFFPRLRRQAKWMFVVLAIVFMLGFVGFGVGSGSSGIADLFNGHFLGLGGGGSSGPSVHKAQSEIAKHPSSPKGYRDLATAYENKSQTDQAVQALVQYTNLRPKDGDALRELASLYLKQASEYSAAAAQAQQSNPVAVAGQIFQPPQTTKLGQALAADPIQNAIANQVNTTVSDQSSKLSTADQNAIAIYKRLTALTPNDPSAYGDLAAAAEQIGDYRTAITAYEKIIKLEPDSSDVPQIKQRIKQLKAAVPGTGSG